MPAWALDNANCGKPPLLGPFVPEKSNGFSHGGVCPTGKPSLVSTHEAFACQGRCLRSDRNLRTNRESTDNPEDDLDPEKEPGGHRVGEKKAATDGS
jgi:hypothetical protein